MPCNLCGKWNCVCQYSQPKQEQDKIVQVTIKDFVKAVEGKEHLMGRPVYWAQWPNGNTTPQPKQEQDEPIAFVTGVFGGRFVVEPTNPAMVLPVNVALYTHPKHRKPLTDEQIDAYLESEWTGYSSYHDCFKEIVRWAEAKHDIKE